MTIDFHSVDNRGTYATRSADGIWAETVRSIVDPAGTVVADIGCGGGIYSRAWADLGASRVIGVDFSSPMVEDAKDASVDYPTLWFAHGDAASTGLRDASVDVVFSRALIHHLTTPAEMLVETFRILRPGGTLIVQDRVLENVLAPPSPSHLRGYFFERYPRLVETERERRPKTERVVAAMRATGFQDIGTMTLVEPRRCYESIAELQSDLRNRTGRSILHALSNNELDDLIAYITARVSHAMPIQETDSWTIWRATRPCHGLG